ncbi:hypothetical protein HY484_03900 [Candidatus Woesearchaeota archaeon]|nr:hypothetical protein [Candidatus Woesearchaeota archaeon]
MKEATGLEELAQILSGSPFYIPVKCKGQAYAVCNPELAELEPWNRSCDDVEILKSRRHILFSMHGVLLILKSASNLYLINTVGAINGGYDLNTSMLHIVARNGWENKRSEDNGMLFPLGSFLKAEMYLPGKNAEIRFYQEAPQ